MSVSACHKRNNMDRTSQGARMSRRKKASREGMEERRGNHYFFNKLVILFFIIIAIFMAAFYRSFLTFSETLKRNTERNIILQTAESSIHIGNTIKNLTNQIDGMICRTEIRSMKWKEQEPVLNLECKRCGIESIQIAALDGKAKSTMGYEENLKDKDCFKAINNETYISEPIVRDYDGKTVVLFSAPIQDKDERVVGVLVAHMDIEFLFNIMQNMRLGETGYGFIINREGKLLAHSLLNSEEYHLREILNYSYMGNNDFSPLFDQIVRGETGHGYFTTNGTQRFAAFTPMADTNWSLVLSMERREMFFEVDAVSSRFTTVFIILTLVTVLFGIYCFRYYIQSQKLFLLTQASEKNNRLLLETKEIDKIRTEFFANISHELRTPLNVILSSIQLMNLYMKSKPHLEKETAQKHLGIIRRNSLRLSRLINNLIDTTRINTQFYVLHTSSCNIVEIVREISVSVEDYVKRKGITLNFYTDVQVKNIICDVDKVERILLNLLSNATKFTDEGGRISIFLNDGDAFITLTVEDTGIGIPPDKIGQIFTRFHQVDKTLSRNYEGSGIGLSLVKSMVEMHGGTISVISEPGKGSKFTVTLPVHQEGHVQDVNEYQYDRNQFNQRILIEMSDFFPRPDAKE